MNPYKTVFKTEGIGGLAGKEGLKIHLEIGIAREFSKEENSYIDIAMTGLIALLNKNTYCGTQKFKDQVIEDKSKLLSLFDCPIYVKETENEYGGLTPWYLVTTPKGVIKIGWRKKVINIDWSLSDLDMEIDGEIFFESELQDTTVGFDFIHAWGYEKAKEYIYKLLF